MTIYDTKAGTETVCLRIVYAGLGEINVIIKSI